jgi:hypothetical protein
VLNRHHPGRISVLLIQKGQLPPVRRPAPDYSPSGLRHLLERLTLDLEQGKRIQAIRARLRKGRKGQIAPIGRPGIIFDVHVWKKVTHFVAGGIEQAQLQAQAGKGNPG